MFQGSTIDICAVYGVSFVMRAELEENFNAVPFMFDLVEEHELHSPSCLAESNKLLLLPLLLNSS